jgi:hypothetical protein
VAQPERNIDGYLDYLYNSNVRCPYCGSKILKFTTTCTRCGVTKGQIGSALNLPAREIIKKGTGEKIFMTTHRPADVSFISMFVYSLGGIFGAHCFFVGRRTRGYTILLLTILGILSYFVFPQGSPLREYFAQWTFSGGYTMPVPTDFCLAVSFLMWAFDYFAIVIGIFKYPIRLGDAVIKGKA